MQKGICRDPSDDGCDATAGGQGQLHPGDRAQPRCDPLCRLDVDLGPEGGDKGGEIVVTGTPEEVAEHPTSHTGRYLKQVLEQHPPEVVVG